MNEDRMFELLNNISTKQMEIAEDVAAVKQHLKDINGSVKSQRKTCINTTTSFRKDMDKIKAKVAMASGGLGAAMAILAILNYMYSSGLL